MKMKGIDQAVFWAQRSRAWRAAAKSARVTNTRGCAMRYEARARHCEAQVRCLADLAISHAKACSAGA